MFAIQLEGSGDSKATVTEDENGTLSDQHGNIYTGSFNGKHVTLTNSDGKRFLASWALGNNSVSGIQGSETLQNFTFTFFDFGAGNQRLHALWTFPGTEEQAIRSLKSAGYFSSFPDQLLNRNSQSRNTLPFHMRTRGSLLTGADSGHAILYHGTSEMPTRGEMHIGEHNPLHPIGFFLHLLEIRKEP